MAKISVLDYDIATAANNSDIGSIAILGTSPISNFDNAFRELMLEIGVAITRHVTKAAGTYAPAKTDHNQLWRATGAVTLNLTAAATLTTGWALWLKADGGAILVDPNSSETINGATTLTIPDGSSAFVVCTGTAFFAIVFDDSTNIKTAVLPSVDDGAALGSTTKEWSDLFLASGGVINWANGNYTITHTAGNLAFAGGSASFTSATTFLPQLSVYNTTNDANAPYFIAQKGRAGAAVQVGDTLGTLLFQGLDSTGTPVMQSAAYLTTAVESVGVGSVLAKFILTAGAKVWQFKSDGSYLVPSMTLGTAAAGGMEYDGKAFYANSVASSRQVIAAKQIATVQGSTVALTNSITTAQAIFASANDVLTVAAATTYRFRARLSFNTGATSHTTAFGFGGTATFTTCNYESIATSSGAATLTTPQMARWATATANVLTAASTAVTTDIWLEGIVRINGAGTIIPQITFSAGPTGTCETALDSFFELEPIGSNTVAAIGNWA